MKRLWFSGLVAITLLMGCGRGVPVIESPADGASYNIDQTQVIDVTMVGGDYQDVQIQFRGTEAVPDFTWTPSANAPARAYKAFQNGAGGFSQCTQQRPCTVFIIATKGDQKDFRTISLFR